MSNTTFRLTSNAVFILVFITGNVANSTVQTSTGTFFHNAILFIDTSNNE